MGFYNYNRAFENNTALIDENGRHYTYREISGLGRQILEKVGERQVLLLLCDNSVEAVTVYISALQKGVVPLMVNAAMQKDLLLTIFHEYRPAYIFMKETDRNPFEQCHCIHRIAGYALFKADIIIDYPIHENLALLLTTSGSTGSPKLVRQSYYNIQSNACSIAEYLDIRETDTAVTTLPLNYTYGLSIINSHLQKGAAVVITERNFFDREFWELCRRNHVTNFGGVPYSYDILLTIGFEEIPIPSLRYITQAGGKLHEDKVRKIANICKRKQIKFIIMYGQTEATARMSYLPWEQVHRKSASIGIAIPDGRFILEDEKGNEIINTDQTGELVYYGPNVTLGYAENYYDLRKGDEFHGILHTGDLATRDKEGYYYIVGRKKRFIKLFGNRINLDETEQLLFKNNYSCVCGGTDDCLIIYTDQPGKNHEILDYISKVTGFHKNAFLVKEIKEIPHTQSGKVDYSALPS